MRCQYASVGITLGALLVGGSTVAAAGRQARRTDAANPSFTPDQWVRDIRRQVQGIERMKGFRKIELWREPENVMAFRPGGATAYVKDGQLHKVVVVGPKGCTAGTDVREWYFVQGHPVFMLETLSWYTYTKDGRILPTIKARCSRRYYFHGDQLVRTVPAAQEEGDEGIGEAALAQEAGRLKERVKKCSGGRGWPRSNESANPEGR